MNDQMIDLGMDTDITHGYEYSDLISDALTDIPSISVVTDLKNLFDPTTGIYVNALKHSEGWERLCSVELLNPSGHPVLISMPGIGSGVDGAGMEIIPNMDFAFFSGKNM